MRPCVAPGAADHEPDRSRRRIADCLEAVGHGGVEADRVTGAELVLLVSDGDPERSARHESVLASRMVHEGAAAAGCPAHAVLDFEEVDVALAGGIEPLPSDDRLEFDHRAAHGALNDLLLARLGSRVVQRPRRGVAAVARE